MSPFIGDNSFIESLPRRGLLYVTKMIAPPMSKTKSFKTKLMCMKSIRKKAGKE